MNIDRIPRWMVLSPRHFDLLDSNFGNHGFRWTAPDSDGLQRSRRQILGAGVGL